MLGEVINTCNPTYMRGIDKRITVVDKNERYYLENNLKQKSLEV
jgi:hypothetical protein